MKLKKLYTIILYINVVMMLLFTASCNKKQEKPKPPENFEETKMISALDESIEDVIKEIEKQQEQKEKNTEEKTQQNKGEESGSQQSENQGEGQKQKEGQQEQQGQKEQQQNKQIQTEKGWESVKKKVEEIHSSWNDYETKAIEGGVRKEDIDKFESSLNNLTIAVESKDTMKSLVESNNMTLFLANFLDFYKSRGENEIMKLKYYVRLTYLTGQMGQWDMAEKSITESQTVFDRLRQRAQLEKKDEKLLDKLKVSLEDIAQVIKNKNNELLKIKRDIAITNLEKVKEAMK